VTLACIYLCSLDQTEHGSDDPRFTVPCRCKNGDGSVHNDTSKCSARGGLNALPIVSGNGAEERHSFSVRSLHGYVTTKSQQFRRHVRTVPGTGSQGSGVTEPTVGVGWGRSIARCATTPTIQKAPQLSGAVRYRRQCAPIIIPALFKVQRRAQMYWGLQ
jgi:hypothetical protein